jgi:hypothetical protein
LLDEVVDLRLKVAQHGRCWTAVFERNLHGYPEFCRCPGCIAKELLFLFSGKRFRHGFVIEPNKPSVLPELRRVCEQLLKAEALALRASRVEVATML